MNKDVFYGKSKGQINLKSINTRLNCLEISRKNVNIR